MFAGVAVMGYTMFGESTQSQFTLNMPHNLVASKIAVWTTVMCLSITMLLLFILLSRILKISQMAPEEWSSILSFLHWNYEQQYMHRVIYELYTF